MCFFQAIKPMFCEEGIRPALMVATASPAFLFHPLAEDTPQAHAYPAVESLKRPLVAVLEVLKPAAKRRIWPPCDLVEAAACGAGGPLPDCLLELVQAFRSRAACAVLESVAQEVKAVSPSVNDPRLGWVQGQASRSCPLLHHGEGAGRFLRTATQDHEVVRVAHHLESFLSHQVVQRIQIDVTEQRADD